MWVIAMYEEDRNLASFDTLIVVGPFSSYEAAVDYASNNAAISGRDGGFQYIEVKNSYKE